MLNQPRGGHIFNIDGAGSDGRPTPRYCSITCILSLISELIMMFFILYTIVSRRMQNTWEKHKKSVVHLDDMHNVLNHTWCNFRICGSATMYANHMDHFFSIIWITDGANNFILKHVKVYIPWAFLMNLRINSCEIIKDESSQFECLY